MTSLFADLPRPFLLAIEADLRRALAATEPTVAQRMAVASEAADRFWDGTEAEVVPLGLRWDDTAECPAARTGALG